MLHTVAEKKSYHPGNRTPATHFEKCRSLRIINGLTKFFFCWKACDAQKNLCRVLKNTNKKSFFKTSIFKKFLNVWLQHVTSITYSQDIVSDIIHHIYCTMHGGLSKSGRSCPNLPPELKTSSCMTKCFSALQCDKNISSHKHLSLSKGKLLKGQHVWTKLPCANAKVLVQKCIQSLFWQHY